MEKILDSKQKGILTELQCITAFSELGYHISIPYGENLRYDFVVDINKKLYKIQVKTSSLKENSYLEFATSTSHTNTKGTLNLSYSSEDVDFFATIYENQCYLIPFSVCGKRSQRLRLIPTKNGQTKGITFAKDYEIDKILENLK